MKEKLTFLFSKKTSLFLFTIFAVLNVYYFVRNFLETFFNTGSNADEYYDNNLYSISSVTFDKIFYTSSQPYIFLSSLVNIIINRPKISVRLISLLSCAFLLFYFIKRIKSIKDDNDSILEKTYRISFFVCTIFITNQMFIGTSDFLSVVFLVFAFFYILDSISFGKVILTYTKSIVVGVLFALAVATRPTAIVLIASFYLSYLIILGFKNIFIKQNCIIVLSAGLVFILINFLPLVQQKKVILDEKEIPKATGVNWFQMNYLMAKFWDEGKLPSTKWISSTEVINFKKEHPDFVFPKNQVDLMIKEPGLFCRQLLRMFTKGLYSSYRYMYLFFPLLFLSFYRGNTYNVFNNFNWSKIDKSKCINKILVFFHLISIVLFSFLAVKLLEFRWLIPSLILYAFFSIMYLSYFSIKVRFFIYNISFFCGIVFYSLFFMKEGFFY